MWVAEPGSERIEIFSLTGNRALAPTHLGFVPYQASRNRGVTNGRSLIYGEIVLSLSMLRAAKLSTDGLTDAKVDAVSR